MKLPDGWEMYSLGDIFTFKNGLNAEKASYGKGIKFINVMDVLQGNSITADIVSGQITLPEKKIKENLVKKGDVLFNRTSETPEEIGMTSVYLDDEDVVFGGFVIKGRPIDNKLDNMFKKYCFFSESVRKEIIRRGQGAVRVNIGQKDLSKVSMTVPSIPEQKAIADLLSTWDEAIEKTERMIQVKEKRFKWLLDNLIVKPCREGKWKEVRLSKLFEPMTEKNTVDETNVLTTSAEHGLVSQFKYYKKSVSAEDVSGYHLLKKGDFAYNRSSSNGCPYGVIKRLDESNQGVLSTLYICMRPISDQEMNSDFYVHLFESGILNRKLRGICQEGARSHGLLNLSKSDYFAMKIPYPAIEIQDKVAEVLNLAESEIELLCSTFEKYKTQKRGLMQKMLTGEWQVREEIIRKHSGV
ncbi:MAG: restriction endonuclease subunit S [Methanolobus sp.]|uniref:restriction endonuclease subunit S n=1 Tax=Methanolobus sp. TaxID=1874737 RepID=UPI00273028F0|nr:restriction endonuclease subunit S [Methanolobus sp.]MDP2215809.1 restriction endonuclease subunit S [Methanolobus sp.]